jgi:hypothetical protein
MKTQIKTIRKTAKKGRIKKKQVSDLKSLLNAQITECRVTHATLRKNLEGELTQKIDVLTKRADENKAAIAALHNMYENEIGTMIESHAQLLERLGKITTLNINGVQRELVDVIGEIYTSTLPERASQNFKKSLTLWQAETSFGRFLASKVGRLTIGTVIIIGTVGAFHLLVMHFKETMAAVLKWIGVASS